MLVLWEKDDKVRKKALTVFAFEGLLRLIMFAPAKARKLKCSFKLGFSPVSHQFFITFERLSEIACLRRHHLAHVVKLLYLRFEYGVLPSKVGMNLVYSRLKAIDLFRERF